MFNTLLDRTLEMRDGLGEAGTSISMSIALESLLRLEQRRKARAQAIGVHAAAAAAAGAEAGGATGYGLGEGTPIIASGVQGVGGVGMGGHENGVAAAAAGGVVVSGAAPTREVAGGGAMTAAAAVAGGGVAPSQSQLVPAAVMEARLIQWHMANIEFANAARLGNLSMKVRARIGVGLAILLGVKVGWVMGARGAEGLCLGLQRGNMVRLERV